MKPEISVFMAIKNAFMGFSRGFHRILMKKRFIVELLRLGANVCKNQVHVQYCSEISWQLRLETLFSILEVFENGNQESSFEVRVWSFKFGDSRIIFQGSQTEISRKPCGWKQSNSDMNKTNDGQTVLISPQTGLNVLILKVFENRGSRIEFWVSSFKGLSTYHWAVLYTVVVVNFQK